MSIFRCSHCLPDCESTIYTSSVSATPLRRSWPWWWWWWKSPTPAWCASCLSKNWPSLTLLTMIILTSLGILSNGPGVTRRTLVWRCSASLTAMFLSLLFGRTRCQISEKIYQSLRCVSCLIVLPWKAKQYWYRCLKSTKNPIKAKICLIFSSEVFTISSNITIPQIEQFQNLSKMVTSAKSNDTYAQASC